MISHSSQDEVSLTKSIAPCPVVGTAHTVCSLGTHFLLTYLNVISGSIAGPALTHFNGQILSV